jgi:hypothetical protein
LRALLPSPEVAFSRVQDEFNIVDSKCKKIEDRASKLKFNFEVIVYLKQG